MYASKIFLESFLTFAQVLNDIIRLIAANSMRRFRSVEDVPAVFK